MTAAIARVTGSKPEDVRRRLWREFVVRGSTVKRTGDEIGITRYVFNDKMVELYSKSDAFLYELALWNVNLMKRSIRSWVTGWVTKALGPKQKVLTWGDGLGFDSLSLAEAGHDVTCFDLPGYTSSFAQDMLSRSSADVMQLRDADELPEGAFDVVVCLDVLEHVPDVHAELARLRRCLRPGGVLIVHAPFYFIHRVSVTHLRKHRRHSGSLSLFRKAGFSLVDANPTWAPLVFARSDGERPRRPWLAWPRLAVALPFGLVLSIGRVTTLPFEAVNLVCRLTQMWFPHDMLRRRATDAPGA